jgi:hypothetical protein
VNLPFFILVSVAMHGAAAADVYKCPTADGKLEFRDRPCPNATGGSKVVVQPNSVGELDQSQLKAKREAIDKRLGTKIAADDAERARDAAAMAKRNARCQEYVDEAYRQAAWLGSYSVALRQSAAAEMAIQRRKFEAENCGTWP